ncbi:hypothetical protein HK098_007755 [Nowakowskiella sp. JEL0407]|nr:hypothetical protein HK098_007755 [Nowakowskiella sp. JEL0407]
MLTDPWLDRIDDSDKSEDFQYYDSESDESDENDEEKIPFDPSLPQKHQFYEEDEEFESRKPVFEHCGSIQLELESEEEGEEVGSSKLHYLEVVERERKDAAAKREREHGMSV